jgi:hypothetical protein
MSEQELYEVARQRIDRRNRRWIWWSVDLAGLLACIGLFIVLADTPAMSLALFVMLTWIGVFVLHTIIAGLSESRDEDIAGEIAKLRDADFEKPKRVEVGDDGELVETEAEEVVQRSQHS